LEPHLYFTRGRYRFALNDNLGALEDFSKGLQLCDHWNSDYYREEILFWRAETLLRLGKKEDALIDLARVSDDFSSFPYKLRTKRELTADCADLAGEGK
jgi:hypothetical protein